MHQIQQHKEVVTLLPQIFSLQHPKQDVFLGPDQAIQHRYIKATNEYFLDVLRKKRFPSKFCKFYYKEYIQSDLKINKKSIKLKNENNLHCLY